MQNDRWMKLAFVAAVVVAPVLPRSSIAQATASTVSLDGLEIEFDASGAWTRMYSMYRQPVSFPDRVGLRKAYTIAEEKGKAQIIRFMQENVTSERLIEEVNTEVQQATRNQSGGNESMSRTTQREMVESVKEFTRSYSAGTLRGVTVLEQGYDEKAEEVWVKIGLSRRTAGLGQQLQQDLANPRGTGTKGVGGADQTETGPSVKQGAEVKTRKPPH
jgi:hypothetical protein